MRVSNFVFSSYLVSDDDLIDIIEFIPVLVFIVKISVKWFKLRTSRYCHVQSLSSVETLLVEEIEIVLVYQITQELV
jgi:hypothetical protein